MLIDVPLVEAMEPHELKTDQVAIYLNNLFFHPLLITQTSIVVDSLSDMGVRGIILL